MMFKGRYQGLLDLYVGYLATEKSLQDGIIGCMGRTARQMYASTFSTTDPVLQDGDCDWQGVL